MGDRPSVRFHSRIVPSCVNDPIGRASPRLTSSTPAMKVVLTAPIPGVNIPSFPFAGAIFVGRCILFPLSNSFFVLLQSVFYPCSLCLLFASAVKSSESFLSFFSL
jgi:hypothetical protein